MPNFHYTPSVDRYLESEGAIAQAVNPTTILLHSSVFSMDTAQLRLLLLHELAHLMQLARPGNDPIRVLEAEAWDAAHAWSDGKPFRIRGHARRPLNAVAIIQAGRGEQAFAQPWYSTNPIEPIDSSSTVAIKDVVMLKDMSLDLIMNTIIQKKDKDVLIVAHGWQDGLALPIIAGPYLGVVAENIVRLSADRSFKYGEINTPVIGDKDVANQFSEDTVRKLRAKMNQIRDLKLNHVAFRSCDMGAKTDTLDAFRNFFGAASVSAPKLKDSYAKFSPSFGGNLDDWAKKNWKIGYRVWIDNGVGFGIKQSSADSLVYAIIAKARDKSSFATWSKVHITDHANPEGVVYHGMADLTNPDRTAPAIYFVRDTAFKDNLVNYSG